MQTICVEQILTLLVTLDPAFRTSDPLSGDAPQQSLALVAVGRVGGRPKGEVVRGGAGDRVDQGLEGLFVHVQFLWGNFMNKIRLINVH